MIAGYASGSVGGDRHPDRLPRDRRRPQRTASGRPHGVRQPPTATRGHLPRRADGDLRVATVWTTADVSLRTTAGSIVDARNDGHGDARGASAGPIDLDANGRRGIGNPTATNDLDIDSAPSRRGGGDVGLEADDDIFLTETDGALAPGARRGVRRRRAADRPRERRRTPTRTSSCSHDGTVRFAENGPRSVAARPDRGGSPRSVLAAASATTSRPRRTAQILAGESIDIYGDHANADAGYGTTILLLGDVAARIIAQSGATRTSTPSGSALRAAPRAARPSTRRATSTSAAARASTAARTSPPRRRTARTGSPSSTCRRWTSRAGHTLTLDGQADTDTYEVHTSGTREPRATTSINVLDTGAPADGVDTLDRPRHGDERRHLPAAPRSPRSPARLADRPAFVAPAARPTLAHAGLPDGDRRSCRPSVRRRADQLRHGAQRRG